MEQGLSNQSFLPFHAPKFAEGEIVLIPLNSGLA